MLSCTLHCNGFPNAMLSEQLLPAYSLSSAPSDKLSVFPQPLADVYLAPQILVNTLLCIALLSSTHGIVAASSGPSLGLRCQAPFAGCIPPGCSVALLPWPLISTPLQGCTAVSACPCSRLTLLASRPISSVPWLSSSIWHLVNLSPQFHFLP